MRPQRVDGKKVVKVRTGLACGSPQELAELSKGQSQSRSNVLAASDVRPCGDHHTQHNVLKPFPGGTGSVASVREA